jgi:hypothetical protein
VWLLWFLQDIGTPDIATAVRTENNLEVYVRKIKTISELHVYEAAG